MFLTITSGSFIVIYNKIFSKAVFFFFFFKEKDLLSIGVFEVERKLGIVPTSDIYTE